MIIITNPLAMKLKLSKNDFLNTNSKINPIGIGNPFIKKFFIFLSKSSIPKKQ